MHVITVRLEDGIVDVTGVPPGVKVEVMDFDTGDTPDDELEIDADGNRYELSTYEGGIKSRSV